MEGAFDVYHTGGIRIMRYEEMDYNGKKLKIKVFDYDTPEGWHEFVRNTYGSIDDETFVRPADGYALGEEVKFD